MTGTMGQELPRSGPGPTGWLGSARLVSRLGKPGRYKTMTWLVELEGRQLILKEAYSMPSLLRLTYGRLLISGETRIYRRLQGLEGIPRLVKRLGPYGFLAENIPGLPLDKRSAPLLPGDFFDRLGNLVDRIHARGVLHLDLGHRKNILLRHRDRQPVILDFGSALGWGLPRPLFRLLHLLLGWVDRRGVLMQRMRYGGEPLDEQSRRSLKRMNLVRSFWIFNRSARNRRF